METTQKLKTEEQKLARLERNLAQTKLKERRADTRQKIEFGGLVIKSKMNTFSKVVILGALIDALETLEKSKETETVFRLKGEAAFMGFKE